MRLIEIVKRATRGALRQASRMRARQRDSRSGSWALSYRVPRGPLRSFLVPPAAYQLEEHLEQARDVSELYVNHYFDLLGSGWVQVKRGMRCRGMEGYRYAPKDHIRVDQRGGWLRGLLNRSNLAEAQRIWR